MNRRKFFGFLAAAPVVIPAAVAAYQPVYSASKPRWRELELVSIDPDQDYNVVRSLHRLDRQPLRFTDWTRHPDGSMSAEFRQ